MIDRKFQFLDAETSARELIIETLVNFLYGFIANTVTVFIILKYDIAILINFLIYYMFVSIVINREKYQTKVGKYMIFPSAAALGAFVGYKLAFLLSILQ
jgi:hypothetical protein